jgi:hypothetical protein
MLRNYVYLILTVCLLACKVTHCSGDKIAIAEFEKRYNLIKSAEEANAEVVVDDYRDALFFLSNVTGIVTRAEYSSTVGYRDKAKYREDMDAWRNWLNKNKCKLTQHYIDSAMVRK